MSSVGAGGPAARSPALAWRSDPARSTRLSLPTLQDSRRQHGYSRGGHRQSETDTTTAAAASSRRRRRLSSPHRMCPPVPPSASGTSSDLSVHSTVMVKIECDRDESWFIAVAPTDLFRLPTDSTDSSSATQLTVKDVRSLT